jgi:hypothetical protein
MIGFSPEGGIGTAGVRKPPEREHPLLLLSPEGDTERVALALFPDVSWIVFNFTSFKHS